MNKSLTRLILIVLIPTIFFVSGALVVALKVGVLKAAANRFEEAIASVTQRLPGAKRLGLTTGSTSRYVAVYLNNGNVYFGKFSQAEGHDVVLTDVYFLNTATPTPQQEKPKTKSANESVGAGATAESASSQTEFQLARLTDQFQRPTDKLLISRDHILFWEYLRADSKVVQAIEKYHTEQSTQTAP